MNSSTSIDAAPLRDDFSLVDHWLRVMIRFLFPELFLLAIPMWFAYRRWGRAHGTTGFLRIALLVLLLLALTGPQVNFGGKGIDVIVIADPSPSLPPGNVPRIRALIANLQKN